MCFMYKVTRLRLSRLGELNALYKRIKYCMQRVDCLKTVSARVKCKHTPTPTPSELFCSYVLYVI